MAQEKTWALYVAELTEIKTQEEAEYQATIANKRQWEQRIQKTFAAPGVKSNIAELEKALASIQPEIDFLHDVQNADLPPAQKITVEQQVLQAFQKAVETVAPNHVYNRALQDASDLIKEVTTRIVEKTITASELNTIFCAIRTTRGAEDAQLIGMMDSLKVIAHTAWDKFEEEEDKIDQKNRESVTILETAAFKQYLKENPREASILKALAAEHAGTLLKLDTISQRVGSSVTSQEIRKMADELSILTEKGWDRSPVSIHGGNKNFAEHYSISSVYGAIVCETFGMEFKPYIKAKVVSLPKL